MAIVLYQGGEQNKPLAGSRAEPIDLRTCRDKINDLKAEVRARPYIGLNNQGATCYMNCLL
jgi:ubiquitin C-terminal hydrolase